MSHRFPIQEAVFPKLQLNESAKDKLINTALMQLTRALRDYDKYQKWQASRPPSLRHQLHPAMWKPVKTMEQLTVYRRVPADDAVVTAPSKGIRRRARSRTLEAMRLARATGQDSVSSAPKESVTDDTWSLIPNRGSGPTANTDWNMPTLLQTSSNTVDVYMKTNFEPNGSVHESVALLSAANSLTYCLKAALCAQNKKLSWLLTHPKTDETEAGSARPSTVRIKKRNDCGVCTRPIGTFSRGHTCRVCSARACSTCCVKKKLSFPGPGYKAVDQRSVAICTHCLTHARKLNSLDIAKQEISERKRLSQRRGTLRGTEASSRSTRSRSNSRVDGVKLRRGTMSGRSNNEREQEKADAEKVFLTTPVRRVSRTPRQTQSQREMGSNAKPAWDYNSETEDNDDDDNTVVRSNRVLMHLDSQPRTRTKDTTCRSRSNSKGPIKTIRTPKSRNADSAIPVAARRDIWDVDSEAEDEDDYDCSVVSSQAVSMHQEVPVQVDDSLPEAVVQYAWGAVVPSPTNRKSVGSPAAWPSPPSSPLHSPKPLLQETEESWPTAEGERATVWTPPTMPRTTQIPRINAGASTSEVLAQFAELCNAAENVYQAARKATITHLDPRPTTTRLDMSAVD
ncbi:uncharacterized protein KRP23_15246 [Phytophthora ramorum]|uniref:uncharacterized protein n=1 Tax=Phytophthora ramorum TaxID=164328 RepID=UPI003099ED9A|nr:hypothetical protein KRP23_15246 [Phytophthora ramorum]